MTLEFSSTPATIPTLNGWGIALFSALLGLLGWRNSRRSRGLKAKRG
ncbi:MAG: IPTL-CTERM sorting domain-containing protein [Candidatus Competibacteraceae bacterium]|nr:IPTL-CTERM sorting domain-containing protein [Candidatus Competibacteraceae bacterium]